MRALRNPASVGLFPAVKVPCANWDDEPGDPYPSPTQDSPGFPRPLAASFCHSVGLRWAVERRERGGGGSDSRLITSETALRVFTQILLLQQRRAGAPGERRRGVSDRRKRSTVTVY